ncbi:hypothetical protein [Arthrobacter sp. JSM 101049]|uniref:hypothetical protein n=1 Tax=Arthrobacter sp. JSM 101049 TaxID=929097 RepID=UPI0035645E49
MSDPTTGHDPERSPGQPEAREPAPATEPLHPRPSDPAQPREPEETAGTTNPQGGWDSPAPAPVVEPEPVERRGVPLGTLVFGLVVVAVGLLILVSVFYDISLSGSAVAIAVFLGAGLVLVIGGLVAARRSSGTNQPGA